MFCLVLYPSKQSRSQGKLCVLGVAIGCKCPFLRSGSASFSLHCDLLRVANMWLARIRSVPGALSCVTPEGQMSYESDMSDLGLSFFFFFKCKPQRCMCLPVHDSFRTVWVEDGRDSKLGTSRLGLSLDLALDMRSSL